MITMNPSFVVLKINKKTRGQSNDEEQSGDVRRVLWLRVVPWDGTVSLWWKSVPNPRPRRALLSSHSSICPIWKVNKSLQFVSFAKWQICTTDNILVGLKNVFFSQRASDPLSLLLPQLKPRCPRRSLCFKIMHYRLKTKHFPLEIRPAGQKQQNSNQFTHSSVLFKIWYYIWYQEWKNPQIRIKSRN